MVCSFGELYQQPVDCYYPPKCCTVNMSGADIFQDEQEWNVFIIGLWEQLYLGLSSMLPNCTQDTRDHQQTVPGIRKRTVREPVQQAVVVSQTVLRNTRQAVCIIKWSDYAVVSFCTSSYE